METLKPAALAVSFLLLVAGVLLTLIGRGDGVWTHEGIRLVHAPAERTFEWLVAPERRREWVSGLVDARVEPRGRLEKGARLVEQVTVDGAARERVWQLTAYDPSGVLAWHTVEDGVEIEARFEVSVFQNADRSRLDYAVEVHFPGAAARVIEPLLGHAFKRDLEAELDRLQGLAESRE